MSIKPIEEYLDVFKSLTDLLESLGDYYFGEVFFGDDYFQSTTLR